MIIVHHKAVNVIDHLLSLIIIPKTTNFKIVTV